LFSQKIKNYEWSIKVFKSDVPLADKPPLNKWSQPTLQAADVTDVPAEFVADPFMIADASQIYMFFEVLNKKSGRGEVGLATSTDGEKWSYQRIVLAENYHLSYPHVFKVEDDIFMIPESAEANGVFLYQSSNFPYEWEKVWKLISGAYTDSSIFRYADKWWMFVSSLTGNLHLFFSDTIRGKWTEHPNSPVISGDHHITRPAGRVMVHEGRLYRFTQEGVPYYGKSVRSIHITKLSETEYQEEQPTVILTGSGEEGDWRKDGMHHIDQMKMADNEWLIAVDGHAFHSESYLKWRLKRFLRHPFSDLRNVWNRRKGNEKALGGG
jgi:hypothetical protein